jgi:hypothetical protein
MLLAKAVAKVVSVAKGTGGSGKVVAAAVSLSITLFNKTRRAEKENLENPLFMLAIVLVVFVSPANKLVGGLAFCGVGEIKTGTLQCLFHPFIDPFLPLNGCG